MPEISRSKDSQTIGQLIECNVRNIFLQKSCRKQSSETSSRPLSVFSKSFIRDKIKWSTPQFQYIFGSPRIEHKKFQTVDLEICSILIFQRKVLGLELGPTPHFLYDFSGKLFLMSYSVFYSLYLFRYCAICIL